MGDIHQRVISVSLFSTLTTYIAKSHGEFDIANPATPLESIVFEDKKSSENKTKITFCATLNSLEQWHEFLFTFILANNTCN